MARNRAALVAAALAALVAAVPAPAWAAGTTKAISATVSADWASCDENGASVFALTGVAGTTGVLAPESVTATLVAGGTRTVARSRVDQNLETAYYEVTGADRFTGDVTALVDPAWQQTGAVFGLVRGPCTATALTIEASARVVPVGATVTVSARLTAAGGSPLANRTVQFRLHSLTRTGPGQEIGPLTTDTEGRFGTTVLVDEPWRLSVAAEYVGQGPAAGAEVGADARAAVYAFPGTVPPAAGVLASSSGTQFGAGPHATRVSGSGFAGGSEVVVGLYSTPALLTTATANDMGAFEADVTLPDGPAGGHTIVALGESTVDDEVALRVLALPITITAPSPAPTAAPGSPEPTAAPGSPEPSTGPGNPEPTAAPGMPVAYPTLGTGNRLPVTGTPLWRYVLAGALLVLAGAAVAYRTRRRRNRFTSS